jgi:hypothetical protein
MKNIISYIIAITLPAIFFTLNTAGAGGSLRIFEMAESGIAIEFPMTPDEIAAQDTAYGQIRAASKKSTTNTNINLKVFEMGEGGHTVAFPMTAEEITATNAENARLAAVKAAGTTAPPEPVVRYEMAESGHIIEIPEARTDMEPGDSVIARDTTDKAGVRFQ